jgi:hypothetical protein
MSILQRAKHTQAYAKVGIFGFQGSGKTYTASLMAIGLCEWCKIKRVAYFDTETGSGWMLDKLEKAGLEVFQVKSRAFSDLITTIDDCVADGVAVLVIDSITHVWKDLVDSYDKKLNRKGRMQFQDWNPIKGEWGKYTDRFLNSKLHIIVCGRAGYEYDYERNEDGSKDLVKTGTKMKAEGEFGFEPSLVIEMERLDGNDIAVKLIKDRAGKQTFRPDIGSKWIHRAHVLKDRGDEIDGQYFDNPAFDEFKPHFLHLNIGGEHVGVDTSRDSTDRFDEQGRPDWQRRQAEKDIALEEIENYMTEVWPTTNAADKGCKRAALEIMFGRASWTYVQKEIPLETLKSTAVKLDMFRREYPQRMTMDSFAGMSDKGRIALLWNQVAAPIPFDLSEPSPPVASGPPTAEQDALAERLIAEYQDVDPATIRQALEANGYNEKPSRMAIEANRAGSLF